MQNDSSLWRPSTTPAAHLETAALMERVLYEVKRIVVGQDAFLERILVALLAQGHLLIEGVPGLAKTLTVNTLAKVLSGQFKRIQFTPDLLPMDLIGSHIFDESKKDFVFNRYFATDTLRHFGRIAKVWTRESSKTMDDNNKVRP